MGKFDEFGCDIEFASRALKDGALIIYDKMLKQHFSYRGFQTIY